MTCWLTQSLAEVPAGEAWLGSSERVALACLQVEKRRADWRLGRHTAKTAAAAFLGVEPFRSCRRRVAGRELVSRARATEQFWLANLIWSAKEAASKARVPVACRLARRLLREPEWVMTVVGGDPLSPPRPAVRRWPRADARATARSQIEPVRARR
jgi:hypothetical protein